MGQFIGRAIIVLAVVGVMFLIIAQLFMTAPQPERASATPRPIAVFVEEARQENVALTVTSQGEVRPRTEISLVPQVAGRINYVNPSFIEGGFFRAGETLVQIEDADYRLAVVRAQATVAQREQQLAREQAEADLAASEWDELGEGEASALTLREPQMAEARAALAAARASLQEAQLNLARTRISAPFAGRVRAKSADLGQYVTPGTPLGTVFSIDSVLVRIPLTDQQLNLLGIPVAFNAAQAGGTIPVTLSATVAGEVRSWAGNIARTDSAIDPQTRVLYAIAEVDDPYGAAAEGGAPLAVGLFVSAEIQGRSVNDAYVLPRNALRGVDEVYVAQEGGTLTIREVDVVTSDIDRVVVTSGVQAGDLVVTSPVRGASDGMRIQSLDETGAVIAAYSSIEESEEEDTTGMAETAGDNGQAVASTQ
jgi:RND family efflux transporter MFP subunit